MFAPTTTQANIDTAWTQPEGGGLVAHVAGKPNHTAVVEYRRAMDAGV
jgi:hypothetical protein